MAMAATAGARDVSIGAAVQQQQHQHGSSPWVLFFSYYLINILTPTSSPPSATATVATATATAAETAAATCQQPPNASKRQ